MSGAPEATNNAPAFQAIRPGYTQFVNFTNSSGDSSIFEEDTTIVELFATQDCWVLIKVSTSSDDATVPSALAKTMCFFCAGGITKFMGIPKTRGVLYRIAVVRNTANGTLYITEGGE